MRVDWHLTPLPADPLPPLELLPCYLCRPSRCTWWASPQAPPLPSSCPWQSGRTVSSQVGREAGSGCSGVKARWWAAVAGREGQTGLAYLPAAHSAASCGRSAKFVAATLFGCPLQLLRCPPHCCWLVQRCWVCCPRLGASKRLAEPTPPPLFSACRATPRPRRASLLTWQYCGGTACPQTSSR